MSGTCPAGFYVQSFHNFVFFYLFLNAGDNMTAGYYLKNLDLEFFNLFLHLYILILDLEFCINIYIKRNCNLMNNRRKF